jgi:hypothetical protein
MFLSFRSFLHFVYMLLICFALYFNVALVAEETRKENFLNFIGFLGVCCSYEVLLNFTVLQILPSFQRFEKICSLSLLVDGILFLNGYLAFL